MLTKYKIISIIFLLSLSVIIIIGCTNKTNTINESTKSNPYPDVKEYNDLKKCNQDSDCIPSYTQYDCFNRGLVNEAKAGPDENEKPLICICKNNLCQKADFE